MLKVSMVLFLSCFLFDCADSDRNYENVMRFEGTTRVEELMKFPVKERFRIYEKAYRRSAHPKGAELESGFNDEPEESLEYLSHRLPGRGTKDYMMYFPIIYSISRSYPDFCRSRYYFDMKKKFSSYNLNESEYKAFHSVDYGGCKII